MVFWSTLLSFMIGIMYYMLYPGDNKIKDVYMPTSEAFVSGFLSQHQAAKQFARDKIIGIIQLTKEAQSAGKTADKVTGGSSVPPNSVIILTDTEEKKNLIGSYLAGNATETGNLYPGKEASVAIHEDTSTFLNQEFVSVLACLNMPERKMGDTYAPAKLVDCKEATTKYVITYGGVPMNDLNTPYTRGRTILWEHAILKRTHGSPDCGFLYYNGGTVSGKKKYFIHNSNRLTRGVPTDFTDKVLRGYIDPMTDAGRASIGNQSADIMFCMTPVNDPYPRNNLKVLLDSEFNSFSNSGSKYFNLIHEDNVGNNWLNLASPTDEKIMINSSGKENNWFFSSCNDINASDIKACEQFENRKAFSFTTDRHFNITKGKNKNFLGSSFTLSMMIGFNGNGTIFETRNTSATTGCTPTKTTIGTTTYQQPCLTATYTSGSYDGHLAITLKSANGKESTLTSGLIVKGEPTQIDYIFNSTGHRLYINGQLSDNASFEGTITNIDGLAGDALTFGGTGNRSNLYNLAVYNRGSMSDETVDDKFDMYGLPRIYKSNTMRYNKN